MLKRKSPPLFLSMHCPSFPPSTPFSLCLLPLSPTDPSRLSSTHSLRVYDNVPIHPSLQNTDICEHAHRALQNSQLKQVYLVGRQGPLQVSFSAKELRSMAQLPGCRFHFDSSDMEQIRNLLPGTQCMTPNRIVPNTGYVQCRRARLETSSSASGWHTHAVHSKDTKYDLSTIII